MRGFIDWLRNCQLVKKHSGPYSQFGRWQPFRGAATWCSHHRTAARQAHQQVAQNCRQTGTPAGGTELPPDRHTSRCHWTQDRRHNNDGSPPPLLSTNERLTKALIVIPHHLASYVANLSQPSVIFCWSITLRLWGPSESHPGPAASGHRVLYEKLPGLTGGLFAGLVSNVRDSSICLVGTPHIRDVLQFAQPVKSGRGGEELVWLWNREGNSELRCQRLSIYWCVFDRILREAAHLPSGFRRQYFGLYLGGSGFQFRSSLQLCGLRLVVVCLISSIRLPSQHIISGHDHFTLCCFWYIKP